MKSSVFDKLQCGINDAVFFAVLEGQETQPAKIECQEAGQVGHTHIAMQYENGIVDDVYVDEVPEGLVVRRIFANKTGGTLKLNELGLRLRGIHFNGSARDDFFYHNENPRIYEQMTFPIDYKRTAEDAKDSEFDFDAGNRWADPGVVCERIGRSPYQPFPAVLVGNYKDSHALVHGTLSQKVFFHNYLLRHENGTVTMEIYSSFKALGTMEVAPGRILVDEWYLGTTEHSDDVEHIFDEYTAVLRRHLPPMYGASKVNRYTMVWGSWNDGLFRNISEEMILKEARYLKKEFPMVEWIQVDDGYAVNTPPAHGLGMPYEGEAGVDHAKFPNGLRHFTDEVRKIGMRPAVWIGGFCPKYTPIYQEHPEWFIDYDYRVPKSAPLDPSKEETRQYLKYALDTLLLEYGFDGVKQDFWSYAFEDSHDLYRGDKDKSGYQMRDWWLKEFRLRMPPYAHFQTGCDIVMGNPFLGEYYTNYRYGIDIGGGKWDYVRTNFQWCVACLATHTGDLFVPNSDSVGLFPGLNDTEAMFCLDFCLVTHTMIEIAGKLSEHPDSPRLAALKKTVCCPNNGADTFTARYDYRDHKVKTPSILYFKTPFFATKAFDALPVRTVGLFNLEDEPRKIAFNAEDIALQGNGYVVVDARSGEIMPLDGELSLDVKAHGSRLLSICENKANTVLDCNFKVVDAKAEEDSLKLETQYPAHAEMLLNGTVANVTFNGEAIAWEQNGVKLVFELPGEGSLEIFWKK